MERSPFVLRASVLAAVLPLLFALVPGTALSRPDQARAYEAMPVEHIHVPSFDGTVLDGYLWRPKTPAGMQVPVVLWSSAYFGYNPSQPVGSDQSQFEATRLLPVDMKTLVENGYAVAAMSARGTGASEGCFDPFSRTERKDQAHLVTWLAQQEWATGSVGMMGASYDSFLTLAAAVERPKALKTVVVTGIASDLYSYFVTPQGAVNAGTSASGAAIVAGSAFAPPVGGASTEALGGYATSPSSRLCEEVRRFIEKESTLAVTEDRDQAFFKERNLIPDFDRVRASVLLAHGFLDPSRNEDQAWALLRHAPKWQFEGQWGHDWPNPTNPEFENEVVEWLAYWLKGEGPRPAGVGAVDYQDQSMQWHRSDSWPPSEAREEVLYLTEEGKLAGAPTALNASFISTPSTRSYFVESQCASADEAVAFELEAKESVSIAGAGLAFLDVAANDAGGLIGVKVLDVGPGGCPDVRVISEGAADLRFYQGNFVGRDFPIEGARIRIDLSATSYRLEAGHRLVVLVSFPSDAIANPYMGQPFFPEVTLRGDGSNFSSHVVLPLGDGTLGGKAPSVRYPPNPSTGTR